MLRAVTVAPGMAPLCASSTVPMTVAVSCCASRGVEIRTQPNASIRLNRVSRMESPEKWTGRTGAHHMPPQLDAPPSIGRRRLAARAPGRCPFFPLIVGELLDAGAVGTHHEQLAVRLR